MILVNDGKILAIDCTDTGDAWEAEDQIIPKHVVPGAEVVDLKLPDGADKADYTYENGELVYHAPSRPLLTDTINARQLRLALTRVGLRQQIENAVATGDQDLKDWYDWAQEFYRYHPMVLGMIQNLSIPSSVADEVWVLGATL